MGRDDGCPRRGAYDALVPTPPESDDAVAPTASGDSDETLLDRVRENDEGALRTLIRRHEKKMYAVALSMTRNPFDAEDAVGAALLELWRKRDAVRVVDGSVVPWLIKVTTFAAKNQLRGQRRYAHLLARLPRPNDVADHAEEVARNVDRSTLTHDLEAVIRSASATDASVILLCLVEEMTPSAAAEALGLSPSTVSTRLSRAKKRLRAALAHHDPQLAEDLG